MKIFCTLTPKTGGGPIEVRGIYSVDGGVDRQPSPNYMLGQDGHNLHRITIRREKSQEQEGNKPDLDNAVVELANAVGQDAYFAAEISVERPGHEGTKVATYRCEDAHICDLHHSIGDHGFTEQFDIVFPSLSVDNVTFKGRRAA